MKGRHADDGPGLAIVIFTLIGLGLVLIGLYVGLIR